MFYFDTAIKHQILDQWDQLKDYICPKMIKGITTNPNALMKAYKLDHRTPLMSIRRLAKILAQLRGDDLGILYVQWAYNVTNSSLEEFIEAVKPLLLDDAGKPYCKLGIKLPHYPEVFDYMNEHNIWDTYPDIQFNITGIADAFTASKWLAHPAPVISLITGRMEEAGIDVRAHAKGLLQYNSKESRVIAGSMRTLAQTLLAIEYGLTPTIGTAAFNAIFETENGVQDLANAIQKITKLPKGSIDPPLISETNVSLSKAFFEQMDSASQVIEPIYYVKPLL